MDRIWLPEDRERQAKVMRSLRLWDHDLHPRTLEGKAASAQNARKLGLRSAEWKALTFALRIQNQELKKLI
jgi:hypothetical protein